MSSVVEEEDDNEEPSFYSSPAANDTTTAFVVVVERIGMGLRVLLLVAIELVLLWGVDQWENPWSGLAAAVIAWSFVQTDKLGCVWLLAVWIFYELLTCFFGI